MIRSPKGTRDLLPEQAARFRAVEDAARRVLGLYGFGEIITPAFEATELFVRSIGETTDIVEKEMYSMETSGGEKLALRPENTAGVIRAYIEAGLHKSAPLAKFYYVGPMFRHESAQKKRYREFRQIGIEIIGTKAASADAECIRAALDIFRAAGLPGVKTHLSTLGCTECRKRFRKVLRDYFSDRREQLCDDCKRRLERNVFRLLDCKEESCRQLAKEVPSIFGFSDLPCPPCRQHFDEVKNLLYVLGVEYVVDPNLVRGLDYYNRTVYEFYLGEAGRQDALGGGGRYDPLLVELGGPDAGATGFALGTDRIVLALKEAAAGPGAAAVTAPTAYLLPLAGKNNDVAAECRRKAFELADALRRSGLPCLMDYDAASFRSGLRRANKSGAAFAVIIGPEELKAKRATVKDMSTGEQKGVLFENVPECVKKPVTPTDGENVEE